MPLSYLQQSITHCPTATTIELDNGRAAPQIPLAVSGVAASDDDDSPPPPAHAILLDDAFAASDAEPSPARLPQTAARAPRRVSRAGGDAVPAAEGRVPEGGHHAAEEAELGRAQDGAYQAVERPHDHRLHPRRGPQHPAAQRRARARRP
ncbi:hypothetical protein DL767_007443 [Monosporascus sp. MG133]|nr:hypothetical protein DL767_007443 [Monosporascus sp. MG133]